MQKYWFAKRRVTITDLLRLLCHELELELELASTLGNVPRTHSTTACLAENRTDLSAAKLGGDGGAHAGFDACVCSVGLAFEPAAAHDRVGVVV